MSESVSDPASSHCSLWNVTVKIVSRKSPSSTGWARTRSRRRLRVSVSAWVVMRSPRASAAISSTRARRESLSSSALASSTEGSPPFANRPCRPTSASRIAVDVVGRDDDAGAGLADQLGSCAVGRDNGEDRAAGREVLENLPREHALAATARVGDEQEQRLRVALVAQRLAARQVVDQLEPVAESERVRPLAVRRAEVADEARDGVEVGVVERLQERPRIALAEEATRVRDAEASPGRYSSPAKSSKSQPFAIDAHLSARVELAHLGRDRLGDTGDRVGAARDELRHLLVRGLAGPRRSRVVATVLVRDERIAKIGDPARAGRTLDGRADEVDRRGRRRRDHRVDALAARDADRGGDRRQVPRDARVGEEETSGRDAAPGGVRARGRAAARSSSAGFAPAGRRSARGGSRPASARAAPGRGGPTSGRPGRGRASRSPSAGRYCASLSERCTPPPPAGGKYIVTSSTFTAGKGRARTPRSARGERVARGLDRRVDLGSRRAPWTRSRPRTATARGTRRARASLGGRLRTCSCPARSAAVQLVTAHVREEQPEHRARRVRPGCRRRASRAPPRGARADALELVPDARLPRSHAASRCPPSSRAGSPRACPPGRPARPARRAP